MTTDRPFRDEPSEVLQAALGLATTHAQQAARFRPVQEGDALPAVASLLQAELQHREGQTLPPPQGPEYTPCVSCSHIEPEHEPNAGACWSCDCEAYRAAASAVVSPPTNRAELRKAVADVLRPHASLGGVPSDFQVPFFDGATPSLPRISGWKPLNDVVTDLLAVFPEPTSRAAELDQLRTENERMRHELEVMYGGAFDDPKSPPTSRAAVLREAADWYARQGKVVLAAAQVAADLRCRADTELRRLAAEARQQGEQIVTVHAAPHLSPAAQEALGALVDVATQHAACDFGHPHPDHPCGRSTAETQQQPSEDVVEAHRLALSEALHLGNGAPWDAILDRAGDLSRRDVEAQQQPGEEGQQ